ncbi:DUF4340 domain-containing protein [Pelagibius marinus]|uniref:DUF4340 domain-containing protein n=1 Tax=Pelagibius marinus TaxID=2762760 RepID=UPI001872C8C1|nr:DUF4340 domain-containing protein [Pelagibius marinus]
MGKIFAIIGGLLVTVIVAGIAFTIHETGVRDAKKHPAVFDFAAKDVDTVTIEGPDATQLTLRRSGGGWTLTDLDDFPAEARKVDDMLARLLQVERHLPVASDPQALIGFKLADDDFERRLTLSGGGKTLATVYIGTPEGPRQVHLRLAGEDTGYSVHFGLYDASVDNDDWFDRGFLQVAKQDIAAIQVNGLRLASDAAAAEGWRLDPAPVDGDEAPALDAKAADRLAGLLAELRVESFRADEAQPDYALDTPQLTLTMTRRDGKAVTYLLGRGDLQKDFSLKVSTRPEHFRLSVYAATKLLHAAARDALLPPAGDHHAAARVTDKAAVSSHN